MLITSSASAHPRCAVPTLAQGADLQSPSCAYDLAPHVIAIARVHKGFHVADAALSKA